MSMVFSLRRSSYFCCCCCCCDVVMYPVYKYHLDTRRCGPRQQSLDKTFIISFTKHRNMTQTSSKGDPASILCCCCRPFATNIWGTELTGLGPSFCFFNCVVLIFCWKMKIRFSNSTIFHEKLRIYFAGRVACDVTVQWPGRLWWERATNSLPYVDCHYEWWSWD